MFFASHPRLSSAPHHASPRRAAASVEFVVVLPLLVALLVGLWEVGRLVEIEQVMNNAAREGARQAATAQVNVSQVQTVVINYLKAAGVPVNNSDPNQVVQVQNLGWVGNPPPPDNNPQNATQLDQLQVTVTIPFSDVRWIALNLVTTASTQMTGQAVWSCLKDTPYPTVSYPPPE
jgi:Flp pilus assembly protein TadG